MAVFSCGPGNGFYLQCSNEPTAMTFLRCVFAEDHASDALWSIVKHHRLKEMFWPSLVGYGSFIWEERDH